jgi:hypothetical protein
MKWTLKYFSLILVSTCAFLTIMMSYQSKARVDAHAPQPAIQSASVPTLDLSPLKEEVASLSALIKHMQHEDEATYNTLVANIKTELQTKLDTMHESITSLEEKQHPIKMMPETELPFKVISIDSLQHISVATLAYDFKTTALEQGDALAGWQVIALDFARQQIVFQKENNEVHVNLRAGAAHA